MLVSLPRLVAFALVLAVAGCAASRPGEVRSIAQEKQLGEETTPQFLRERGGVYQDGEAQSYVEALTRKLSDNVSIPREYDPIPIRILDTNTPSAYALPGGSIYVSRGIIAMANTEAQLAGVIAHEIGHVIARHSAKTVAANERFVRDVITENADSLSRETSEARQIAMIESEIEARLGELTSFSKEQELEADRLAIQILAASGYGSGGYGEFLQRLDAWQMARARAVGLSSPELEKIAARSGYPKLAQRVAALGALTAMRSVSEARDTLMSVVDGMTFDDRYAGGFIRDGKYWSRQHGIVFDVPKNLSPDHGKHLRLLSPNRAALFRIDDPKPGWFDELSALLKRRDSPFGNPQETEINGIRALTASASEADGEERVSVDITFYDLGGHIASLTMLSQGVDGAAERPLFDAMSRSFRRIQPNEIPPLRRYTARRVQAGDSLEDIARVSAFDGDRDEELRLLNGLQSGAVPAAGAWIKSVE